MPGRLLLSLTHEGQDEGHMGKINSSASHDTQTQAVMTHDERRKERQERQKPHCMPAHVCVCH